ncbi:MAG: hypothetical protein EA380_10510 [Phycisphaeraceae bacterium]|nr:MAG: hypothetical protein EA380_10510 [Phycisphaeraceae bacterium]
MCAVATAAVLWNAPTATAEPQVGMSFRHEGMRTFFPDERDAGLVRALGLLPARLQEIATHPSVGANLGPVPTELFPLIGALMFDPARFVLTLDGLDPDTGLPAVAAVLRFENADEAGGPIGRAVVALDDVAPLPLATAEHHNFPGMQMAGTPFGMLAYGGRESRQGWGWELHFGPVGDPDRVLGAMDKPLGPGVVVAQGHIDFAALTPATRPLIGMASMMMPGQNLSREAVESGLLGARAMSAEFVSGFSEEISYTTMRLRGARAYADRLGLMQAALTHSDLAIIPADATAAFASKIDPERSWSEFRKQLVQAGIEQEVNDVLNQFRRQVGVDIERDLIRALGDTVVAYFSDSTGGGGLLSGVVAVRLSDAEAFDRAIERLSEVAVAAVADQAFLDGPIAFRAAREAWQESAFVTLRVDGLPLPIEPTIGRSGDWAIFALSKSAARGAVEHDTARAGLVRNPAFRASWDPSTPVVSMSFIDAQRTVRDGYASLNLLGTMLAGFVRSSSDPSVDPGMIVPTYSSLTASVQPILNRVYWDADDYIMHTTTDRSRLVHAAALLGVADVGAFVTGLVTGSAITAGIMEQQRSGMYGYPTRSYPRGQWERGHDDGGREETPQRRVPY